MFLVENLTIFKEDYLQIKPAITFFDWIVK
jgi:hypothetical protein